MVRRGTPDLTFAFEEGNRSKGNALRLGFVPAKVPWLHQIESSFWEPLLREIGSHLQGALLALSAANVKRLDPRRPATILVVEDDVLTRFVVADELRAAGFKVLEASTGADAISILETIPVHLVFTDIFIPGRVGGLDVAEAARRLRPAPHVVLTSGRFRPDDIPNGHEFGPFIAKPYLLSRVVDLVRRTLDPTNGA